MTTTNAITKDLWKALGDLVEKHGEEMVAIKERYKAGSISMKISADSKRHGCKFQIALTVDPDEADEAASENNDA